MPNTTPATTGQTRPRRTIDQGWAIIWAAVIAAFAAAGGYLVPAFLTSGNSSPSPNVTITASPRPVSAKGLNFALAPHSPVPWCQVYEGTGTIPHGAVLLIFDTPALPSGNPTTPAHYSFDQEVTQSSSAHWQTGHLQIGTLGVA